MFIASDAEETRVLARRQVEVLAIHARFTPLRTLVPSGGDKMLLGVGMQVALAHKVEAHRGQAGGGVPSVALTGCQCRATSRGCR